MGAGRGRDGTVLVVDARHRDRLGAVRRRPAGAQHRARPPAGRERGGRTACLGAHARRARPRAGQAWAGEVNAVLAELHRLLWPDLFIIGGGVTENWASFRAAASKPRGDRRRALWQRCRYDRGCDGGGRDARPSCGGAAVGAPRCVTAVQAARGRHDHLYGDVAPRGGARRHQPVAGLSGFLAAATPGRARRRRTCAPGCNQYAPMPGLPALREAIARQVLALHGRRVVAGDGDHGHGRRDRGDLLRGAGRRPSAATRSSCSTRRTIPTSPRCGSPAARAVRVPLRRPGFDVDWDRVARRGRAAGRG